MFYTVYKITNLINGKFYIGKHQTNDLNDGYVGSGKLLKRAIKKYGLDQFKTEIIEICPTEAHMNLAEKIYVVIDTEVSYNLCPGGKGDFGYINENILSNTERKRRGRIGGIKGGATLRKRILNEDLLRDRYKSYGVRLNKHNASCGGTRGMLGKKHSEQTKRKMRKSKNIGENNSQFGSFWITDGFNNKKTKDELLPGGWRRGRSRKN